MGTQQNSSKWTYNDATNVCADYTKDDFIIFRLLAVKRIGGDRSKDTEGLPSTMHFALISTRTKFTGDDLKFSLDVSVF